MLPRKRKKIQKMHLENRKTEIMKVNTLELWWRFPEQNHQAPQNLRDKDHQFHSEEDLQH